MYIYVAIQYVDKVDIMNKFGVLMDIFSEVKLKS